MHGAVIDGRRVTVSIRSVRRRSRSRWLSRGRPRSLIVQEILLDSRPRSLFVLEEALLGDCLLSLFVQKEGSMVHIPLEERIGEVFGKFRSVTRDSVVPADSASRHNCMKTAVVHLRHFGNAFGKVFLSPLF